MITTSYTIGDDQLMIVLFFLISDVMRSHNAFITVSFIPSKLIGYIGYNKKII
jgi:hypothetical protein